MNLVRSPICVQILLIYRILALNAAAKQITSAYGAINTTNYSNYKTKSAGAQEAHEAIRPTYLISTLLMVIHLKNACMN